MSGLADPLDKRSGFGVRVQAWMQHAQSIGGGRGSRQKLLRALGLGKRKSYPVQARLKGSSLVMRADAHYSAAGNHSVGSVRSYLEREDARGPDDQTVWVDGKPQPGNVLHQADIEQWPDRLSVWLNPTGDNADLNPMHAAEMLTKELGRRYGIEEADVYIVQHHDAKDGSWHLHAVMPAWVIENEESGEANKVEITRGELAEIARTVARELVLERAVERALDPERNRVVESGWDLLATDKQVAVLAGAGRSARDMTRGEASLVIEEITREPSWYDRGR